MVYKKELEILCRTLRVCLFDGVSVTNRLYLCKRYYAFITIQFYELDCEQYTYDSSARDRQRRANMGIRQRE
jgi:hypothetical protein